MTSPRQVMVLVAAVIIAGGSRAVDSSAPSPEPAIAPVTSSPVGSQSYGQLMAIAATIHGTEFESGYYETAVVLRRTRDQLDDIHARIAVRQDLAAIATAKEARMDAIGYLAKAIDLAKPLEDARILLTLHLAIARVYADVGQREFALRHVSAASDLAVSLGSISDQVAAGLLEAATHVQAGNAAAAGRIYQTLLALPAADLLTIEYHRASRDSRSDLQKSATQWQRVAELARAGRDQDKEAAALDQLGWIAQRKGDPELAVRHFLAAEQLGVPINRSVGLQQAVIEAHIATGRYDLARLNVDQALLRTDAVARPMEVAALRDSLAGLLARDGDTAGAYAALRTATDLRQRAASRRQSMPSAPLVAPVTKAEKKGAADIAAARNARREAELAATRAESRLLTIAVSAAVIIVGLLAVAYLFKRRAAVALATARDAAELRAENAHLLALRYQLNPHFLFNALNGLRSRFLNQPAAAGELLDRLTDFCRQTLTRRPEGLQTVGEECDMLQSFLGIEHARWEENFVPKLDFDPKVRDRSLPVFLLLPLIENALKYGAETSEDRIELSVTLREEPPGTLVFTVTNSGRWIEPDAARRSVSSRIGLGNLRQRLARYYPGRHRFEVGQAGDRVVACLRLTGSPAEAAIPS